MPRMNDLKATSGAGESNGALNTPAYATFFADVKSRIQTARVRAALSVNRELIRLYWDIGQLIVQRQQAEGWGKSIVDQLSKDIKHEYPGIKGYSQQNLWYMRSFFLSWTEEITNLQQVVGELQAEEKLAQPMRELDGINLPQAVGEIPWGHNLALIAKVKDPLQRLWYAQQTTANGWSRAVLVHQIETDAYGRHGKALTNFESTLPAEQSDLAQNLLKDPYTFDFLDLELDFSERQLQRGLINKLKEFFIELGRGFSFVGEQYHLEVGDQDYYLDLLFYHLQLGRYIVIELKVEPFKPEFVGKMNFYLSAVDDLLPNPVDNPAIGLVLCKERNKVIVEYTLRDTAKPMGVSTYTTAPKELEGALPTSKQIEDMLSGEFEGEMEKLNDHGMQVDDEETDA